MDVPQKQLHDFYGKNIHASNHSHQTRALVQACAPKQGFNAVTQIALPAIQRTLEEFCGIDARRKGEVEFDISTSIYGLSQPSGDDGFEL